MASTKAALQSEIEALRLALDTERLERRALEDTCVALRRTIVDGHNAEFELHTVIEELDRKLGEARDHYRTLRDEKRTLEIKYATLIARFNRATKSRAA